MEAFELVLRFVGGFYVFAGIAAMRGVAMDRMMDQMLTAISMKQQPAEEAQKRWLWGVSAMAIGMGGAAMMVLNLWAVPLSLVGLVTQVIYLIWARTAFPPENALEEKGRRQTTNAAILHGMVTALVIAAAYYGLLHPFLDIWALFIPAAGAAILLSVGRHLIWSASKPRLGGFDDPGADWSEPEPPPEVKRVRLEPLWGGANLLDADTGAGIDYSRYMSAELADRIWHWAANFHAGDDHESQEFWVQFASPEAEAEHRREGEAIVAELAALFGDGNATGPVYPNDVRYLG